MKMKISSVKKNLLANFFGIGVQLFTQIALIPLFLIFWDINTYSDWIILTAISSFFAMSDIGLNSVTINRFVIKHTEGNLVECRSLLTNNYLLILTVFLFSILGSLVYVYFVDISKNLGLHIVTRETASTIFILLICHIFLGMASAVLDAIYRASSLNHKAVYIGNGVRLLEGLILMLSLIFHLPLITMVLLYLIPRLISFFYKIIDTKKIFPYYFNLESADWLLFKKVLVPSLTFMSFPIGNALIFQGLSLVVNKFFGAEMLVLYNTTRTLTSFLTQILGAILQAVWPEFSIAYGKKDYERMRELHRKAFVVATTAAIGISVFLLVFGNLIYMIWTQGKVPFDFFLMLAFLIVLIFRNIWSTSSVVLMATNKHSTLGILYVICAFLSIGLSILLANYFNSLIIVVYCLLLLELVLSFFAVKKGLEITKDNWHSLFFSFKSVLIDNNYLFKRKSIKTS